MHYLCFFLGLSFLSINGFSETIKTQNVMSIPTHELQNFNTNSKPVQKLITMALDLATKNLGYLYGSAEPGNGGMDCSGTIYYLLLQFGIKEVPRSSDLIYQWVREKGHFVEVNEYDFSSLEFSHLRPGDLLFWNGTYEIERKINVTHVMLYLGKNIEGEPLMFGSSDGRSYQEKKVYGVSVFDFQLPVTFSKSKFLGYSCIPHVNC
jgi:cell wall-associated NlpC family hydrolase